MIETQRLLIEDYKGDDHHRVFEKQTNEYVGYLYPWGYGNQKQIGYWFKIEGEGFCSESLKTFIEHVPSEYHRLNICNSNWRSQRVAHSCGFVLVKMYPGNYGKQVWERRGGDHA